MPDGDLRDSSKQASDLWPVAALTVGGALNALWIVLLLWAVLRVFGLL
ncbi:hypothetical protein [Salinarimonas soli]|nr:hypothetical protein [Salinarimonas soli]